VFKRRCHPPPLLLLVETGLAVFIDGSFGQIVRATTGCELNHQSS